MAYCMCAYDLQHDTWTSLGCGPFSTTRFNENAGPSCRVIKRLDQSLLRHLIKHPETDMSRHRAPSRVLYQRATGSEPAYCCLFGTRTSFFCRGLHFLGRLRIRSFLRNPDPVKHGLLFLIPGFLCLPFVSVQNDTVPVACSSNVCL
jgi:hypothetical protein